MVGKPRYPCRKSGKTTVASCRRLKFLVKRKEWVCNSHLMEIMFSYKYKYKYFVILSPQGFSGIISNTVWGTFARLL